MSLCSRSLPHLPLATTDLFAGPLVSRYSFEIHFTYNLFLLVFFAPNANLPATVPACHPSTGSNSALCRWNRKEGRNLFQWLPFSSLLCVWRILLVPQTHFCVLGMLRVSTWVEMGLSWCGGQRAWPWCRFSQWESCRSRRSQPVHLPPAPGVRRPGPAADVYALWECRVCQGFYRQADKPEQVFRYVGVSSGVGRVQCFYQWARKRGAESRKSWVWLCVPLV